MLSLQAWLEYAEEPIIPLHSSALFCPLAERCLCFRTGGRPSAAAYATTNRRPQGHSVPPARFRLSVDATDIDRRIFNVHEVVPVRAGESIVLLYPQWLPGHHAPVGEIDEVAGLVMSANGARVEWHRDPVDVFAFHVAVPAGATTLDVNFQFTSPVDTNEGRVVMTPDMLNLQWNAVALYPAGYFARQIMVEPSVRLPEGWQLATALETATSNGATTAFKPVSFNTLVDSPIFAGRYFRRLDLDSEVPYRFV